MLSCREATRLVSEKLDRDMPFWRRLGLRLHVLMCRGCSRYTRQVKTLDRVVSEHYRSDPPPAGPECLSDDSLEQIKTSLRSVKPAAESPDLE